MTATAKYLFDEDFSTLPEGVELAYDGLVIDL